MQFSTSILLIYNRPNKLYLSYSGLDEFKEPEFKGYGLENKEQVSQDKSSFVESSPNVDKETIFPINKKVEFTKPENHEKPVKKSVRQWLMLLGQIGLMLLKHHKLGFGDSANLIGASITLKKNMTIGNPETDLEDLVRLNSPEDKDVTREAERLGYKAAVKLHDQFDDEKRAGAGVDSTDIQQNDKSQYKKSRSV
ncbi:hypothetical protein Tco_0583235 [Tanacetum coccineum]